MQRRHFIRWITAGSATTAAAIALPGCSAALPPEALAAWQAVPDTGDARRWVLAHAILAPHSHNLQSWIVDLRQPGEIILSVDPQRLLPETDPLGRQIMMSQGTFLELLAIAAAERGLRADVELFPSGEPGQSLDTRPTARVRLVADPAVRPDALYAQIRLRRTNRQPYTMEAPSAGALQAIRAAALAAPGMAGAAVGAESAALSEQHRAIALEAWRMELQTPRTLLESYRWLRIGPSEIAQHRDGISINKPFVRAVTALGLFDRSQAPKPGDSNIQAQIDDFAQLMKATPAFWWMATPDNRRATQVNAGRAWARAQLAATAQGLAMQPLSQALQEYPEQAPLYQRIHALAGATATQSTLQMWARLGRGPVIDPAPRRGLAAHIVKA
jgi:hypothetical protein